MSWLIQQDYGLVAPYHTFAFWIKEEEISSLAELNPTRFKKRIRSLIKQKDLILFSLVIPLSHLEIYGVEVCQVRAVKALYFYLHCACLVQEIQLEKYLISDAMLCLAKRLLALFKEATYSSYQLDYPQLPLIKSEGLATLAHLTALAQLKALPSFYIREKVLDAYIESELIAPLWLTYYSSSYERSSYLHNG